MVLQKETNSTFCSKVRNWKQDDTFSVQQCVAGERSLEGRRRHVVFVKRFILLPRKLKSQHNSMKQLIQMNKNFIKSNLEGFQSFAHLLQQHEETTGFSERSCRKNDKTFSFLCLRAENQPPRRFLLD